MERFVVSFCRVFALTVVLCATSQANSYVLKSNDSVPIFGTYGYSLPSRQMEEAEYCRHVRYVQAIQTREKIRTKLISRAEKYLASVSQKQGFILPTAFVIEGLLDFGLPVSDPYIRYKAYRLSRTLSADGQVYDSDGYRLHVQTAYVHRVLKLLGQKKSSKEKFVGDEIIHQTVGFLTADLPANAKEFLSSEFVAPDVVSKRASALGDTVLSSQELTVLANWDAIPAMSVPGNAPVAPQPENSRSAYMYAISTGVNSGVKTFVEAINNIYSSTSQIVSPLRSSVDVRVNGFVLIVQTVVLRV